MRKSKALLCLISIVLLLLALCGCDDNSEGGNGQLGSHDKIALDGYYIKLTNEVRNGDKVVEGNYYVCIDKACTQVVGSMTVAYDTSTGKMREYKAVIGIVSIEKMISFSKNDSSSYYSSMTFGENQAMSLGEWENVTIDPENGVMTTSLGNVTYFANGIEKDYHEEQYIGSGKKKYLACVIERVISENGSLVSENITNYDENGNIK